MADKKENDKNRFLADEELRQVWDHAGTVHTKPEMTGSEIDKALTDVHKRLGWNINTPKQKTGHLSNKIGLYSRYAVAALALIVFGIYFLLMPQTMSVPYGEISTIELSDGSSVTMNSGSTLSYNRFFGWTHRSASLNGEAYFSVQAGDEPFRVEANGTVIEVTGTEFNIRSWQDDPGSETRVAVTEGEVRFYTIKQANEAVQLLPGTMSRWNTKMRTPSSPHKVAENDIAGWRTQRLIFQEQPLIAIFNELERRYDVRIDFEIPEADYETLTAYYSEPQSVEAILEDISMVKDFRYAETANGFRVFK